MVRKTPPHTHLWQWGRGVVLKVGGAEKTAVSLLSLGKSFSEPGFLLASAEGPSWGQTFMLTLIGTTQGPIHAYTHRHTHTHTVRLCLCSRQNLPAGIPPAAAAAHDMPAPITTRGGWGVKRKGWEGGVPDTVFTPPHAPVPAGPPPRNLQFGAVASYGPDPSAHGQRGTVDTEKGPRESERDKGEGGMNWQTQRRIQRETERDNKRKNLKDR